MTFDGLCQEAFGVLKLHPWELWEYTMPEYLHRREGHYNARNADMREHWLHARLIAYYNIVYDGNLSQQVRRKKIDRLIPDIYIPLPSEDEQKQIIEDARAHAKRVTENLKKRGKQFRNRR